MEGQLGYHGSLMHATAVACLSFRLPLQAVQLCASTSLSPVRYVSSVRQLAHATYVAADNLAWDPDYMGSSMMIPVVYVTWFMAVVFCSLLGEHTNSLLNSHARPDWM